MLLVLMLGRGYTSPQHYLMLKNHEIMIFLEQISCICSSASPIHSGVLIFITLILTVFTSREIFLLATQRSDTQFTGATVYTKKAAEFKPLKWPK